MKPIKSYFVLSLILINLISSNLITIKHKMHNMKRYKILMKKVTSSLSNEKRKQIYDQFVASWGDVESFPKMKKFVIGIFIDKIGKLLPVSSTNEEIKKMIDCIKDKLGDKLSVDFLKAEFNTIIGYGRSLGKQTFENISFLVGSLTNILKILTSFTAIKQFIEESWKRFKDFLTTLKDLLVKIIDNLTMFMDPLGPCKDNLLNPQQKKRSFWSRVINKLTVITKNISTSFQNLTGTAFFFKFLKNPSMIKDLITLCTEFLIKGLIKMNFNLVNWVMIGEIVSKFATFLATSAVKRKLLFKK
jgi:hypothetical protein